MEKDRSNKALKKKKKPIHYTYTEILKTSVYTNILIGEFMECQINKYDPIIPSMVKR